MHEDVQVNEHRKEQIKINILREYGYGSYYHSQSIPYHLEAAYQEAVEAERQQVITRAIVHETGTHTGRPKSRRERLERKTAITAANKRGKNKKPSKRSGSDPGSHPDSSNRSQRRKK